MRRHLLWLMLWMGPQVEEAFLQAPPAMEAKTKVWGEYTNRKRGYVKKDLPPEEVFRRSRERLEQRERLWDEDDLLPKKKKKKKRVSFDLMMDENGEMVFVEAVGEVEERPVAEIRREMIKIYSAKNPAKLSEVDSLLAKYEGKEKMLLQAIEAKYLNGADMGGVMMTHEKAQAFQRQAEAAARDQDKRRREAERERFETFEGLADRAERNFDKEDLAEIIIAVDNLYSAGPSEPKLAKLASRAAGAAIERLCRLELFSDALALALKAPEHLRWYSLDDDDETWTSKSGRQSRRFGGRRGIFADLAVGLTTFCSLNDAFVLAKGTSLHCFAVVCAAIGGPKADTVARALERRRATKSRRDVDLISPAALALAPSILGTTTSEMDVEEVLLPSETDQDVEEVLLSRLNEMDVTNLDEDATLVAYAEALRVVAKGDPVLAVEIGDAAERMFGLATVEARPDFQEFAQRSLMKNVRRDADADAMNRMPAPKDGLGEVMLLGRSNVGKSSLVNSLLGRKALAPTSADPGRTRRFVFYDVTLTNNDHFALVDVPGSGFAATPEEQKNADKNAENVTEVAMNVTASPKIASWRALTERYLQIRESLRVVLQLLDARRWCDDDKPVPEIDLECMRLSAEANLQRNLNPAKQPFKHILVLTKTDKLRPGKLRKALSNVQAYANAMHLDTMTFAAVDPYGGLILADDDSQNASDDDDLVVEAPTKSNLAAEVVLTSATLRPPRGRRHLWRAVLNGLTLADGTDALRPSGKKRYKHKDDDDSLIAFWN